MVVIQFAFRRYDEIHTDGEIWGWTVGSFCEICAVAVLVVIMCCVGVLCSVAVQYHDYWLALVRE